jgi:hypothetical protein
LDPGPVHAVKRHLRDVADHLHRVFSSGEQLVTAPSEGMGTS